MFESFACLIRNDGWWRLAEISRSFGDHQHARGNFANADKDSHESAMLGGRVALVASMAGVVRLVSPELNCQRGLLGKHRPDSGENDDDSKDVCKVVHGVSHVVWLVVAQGALVLLLLA